MSQIYKQGTSGGGGGIITIAGDTGTPITGPNVTVFANNASNISGATVLFDNDGVTTSTLHLSDVLGNLSLGQGAGPNTTNSENCTAIGVGSLGSVTNASQETSVGFGSMAVYTGGVSLTGANTAIGTGSLNELIDGQFNIAIGAGSGQNYTGTESSNIIIGNDGVIGESNTLRLGIQGSGDRQINRNFQAGIVGVTVANQNIVTIDTVTGQLGAIASAGGTNSTFSAYLSTDQANVTGDGTNFTIPFDTALVNQGTVVNLATGVFTAPNTGNYLFEINMLANTVLSFTSSSFFLFKNGVDFVTFFGTAIAGTNSYTSIAASKIIPLTAGDQISVVFEATVTGSAKDVTLFGASGLGIPAAAAFSGFQIS